MLNILVPIILGGGIIYWMYREFDFAQLAHTISSDMNWGWMLFSLVFGVTAQVFRGLRWKQTLEPLGEHPHTMTCIHAVFLSYASSLIIPRSGEVVRCGILTRYNNVSFSKSIGTVVTERIIDSLLIVAIGILVFLCQIKTFTHFFSETGTSLMTWLGKFTATGYIVTALCILITIIFIIVALRKLTLFAKLKRVVDEVKLGIFSLKDVRRKWLFAAYTFGIWASYFLHFFLTFYCFDYTDGLGCTVGMVAFIVGTFAVVVPTPNGLGPWHFAVKTILILYGVAATNAETYVLIVHTIQTALIPLLGIYSLFCLWLQKKNIPVRNKKNLT